MRMKTIGRCFRCCCPCFCSESKTSRTKHSPRTPQTYKTGNTEQGTVKSEKSAETKQDMEEEDNKVDDNQPSDQSMVEDTITRKKRMRRKWEQKSKISDPKKIADKHLTEEYDIPEDFKTKEECLLAQGLQMGQEIDRGAFATVSKVIDKKTGEVMACKEIRIGQLVRDRTKFQSLKSELFIMCRTRHQNLIRVMKHFIIRDNKTMTELCYIVMELANGGNVITRMGKMGADGRVSHQPLAETKAKEYFRQTSNGLQYLHKNRIAHKDLKLVNILVCIDSNGKEVLKITDFGLSRLSYDSKKKKTIKARTGAGTMEYMSPQILRLHIYDLSERVVDTLREYDPFKADCWALGVCLYCMVTARLPFTCTNIHNPDIDDFIEVYNKMKRKDIQFDDQIKQNYSQECRQMISQLLEPDPNSRLSVDIVVRHKWLST